MLVAQLDWAGFGGWIIAIGTVVTTLLGLWFTRRKEQRKDAIVEWQEVVKELKGDYAGLAERYTRLSDRADAQNNKISVLQEQAAECEKRAFGMAIRLEKLEKGLQKGDEAREIILTTVGEVAQETHQQTDMLKDLTGQAESGVLLLTAEERAQILEARRRGKETQDGLPAMPHQ